VGRDHPRSAVGERGGVPARPRPARRPAARRRRGARRRRRARAPDRPVFKPTLEQVAADPLAINAQLGTYASFCNLLDMCAVAVHAGEADGGCFGLTVFAPASHDRVAADLARRLTGTGGEAGGPAAARRAAARSRRPPQRSAAERRAHPPVVRASWAPSRPPPAIAYTGSLPARRSRDSCAVSSAGPVSRASCGSCRPPDWPRSSPDFRHRWHSVASRSRTGAEVVGFVCEPAALEGAEEITAHGGWPAYLQSMPA